MLSHSQVGLLGVQEYSTMTLMMGFLELEQRVPWAEESQA
jgi:hypothetical protein